MSGQERDARRARAGYLGALRQLAHAMTVFDAAAVPLEPGPAEEIAPWTAEHQAVMRACAEAWQSVVARRREYDGALRELGHPETWPHA